MTLDEELAAHRAAFACTPPDAIRAVLAVDAPNGGQGVGFVALSRTPSYDLHTLAAQLGIHSQADWCAQYAALPLSGWPPRAVVMDADEPRGSWVAFAKALLVQLTPTRARGDVHDDPALDTHPRQEEYEVAEMLLGVLGEMLPHLANAASGEPAAAPANACPTCDAEVGAWCRPMHEGERPPGGWQHPIRTGLVALSRANERALELARLVLQTPGPGDRRMIDLARAVIYGEPRADAKHANFDAAFEYGRTKYSPPLQNIPMRDRQSDAMHIGNAVHTAYELEFASDRSLERVAALYGLARNSDEAIDWVEDDASLRGRVRVAAGVSAIQPPASATNGAIVRLRSAPGAVLPIGADVSTNTENEVVLTIATSSPPIGRVVQQNHGDGTVDVRIWR